MKRLTYSQPLPRPARKPKGITARSRAKRRRAEDPVKKIVRAACVERDGNCIFAPLGDCAGRSEWMHLEDKKRARTRGMEPEERHTTAGAAMGCARHHDRYDFGQIVIAMTEQGANGPIRAEYQGKVYMLLPILERRVE